ncbi:NADH-quinone oxidoreductase subunit J [Aestuariimicrobium soli]|uniref:NADH-quinone oxidoreductase subunit J n=1 Tax=Aestuariimicrobium soli TaxID=2035834 RepID=UPI003EBE9FA8
MIALVSAAQVAFWALAPFMVLLAVGMVVSRKPVHSAICLAGMMVMLAVQYAALDAPFLFVVQIIVYTGAIMMLFLFVMMLVGVDSSDSVVETIKAHRVASVLAVLGFAGLLIFGIGNAVQGTPVGLEQANAAGGGNVPSVAELIFVRYVFVFEATSALLITAAVGAMVLAHGEQIFPKIGQKLTAARKMRAYATDGEHLGPRPNSGVFARHNAIHVPALLPDGSVAESSLSQTLSTRGAYVDAGELRAPTDAAFAEISKVTDNAGELE